MTRFYEHAGLVVFGRNGRRLLTSQDLRNYVLELFDTYTGGCVLVQEARMFFTGKGYTDEEADTIMLLAEERNLVRKGADDLRNYEARLRRVGAYSQHENYLRSLGYTVEDGFVEVYAPPAALEPSD